MIVLLRDGVVDMVRDAIARRPGQPGQLYPALRRRGRIVGQAPEGHRDRYQSDRGLLPAFPLKAHERRMGRHPGVHPSPEQPAGIDVEPERSRPSTIERPGGPGRLPHHPRVALIRQVVWNIAPRARRIAHGVVERIAMPVDRLRRRRAEEVDAAVLVEKLQPFLEGWLTFVLGLTDVRRDLRRPAQRKQKRRRRGPSILRVRLRLARRTRPRDLRQLDLLPRPRPKRPPRQPQRPAQIDARPKPNDPRADVAKYGIGFLKRSHARLGSASRPAASNAGA